MGFKKSLILVSCLVSSNLLAAAGAAQKPAEKKPTESKGAQLYQAKACGTCHGPDGNKPIAPIYPKLAGQSAVYLEGQFQDIMSGKRNNGQSAVMKATLAAPQFKVSDSELKEISQWLEKQG